MYSLALRTAVPIALDEGERCAIARSGLPIAAAHAVELHPQGANIFASSHLVTAAERAERNGHRGLVLWLTGLPGAGKTTIAMQVERELFRRGYPVYALDGDTLRSGLTSDLDFSDEGRRENIRRVAEVAKLLADGGAVALISLVSPSAADRARAKAIVGDVFREAYVAASLATCEARDPKHLYRRARAGEIRGFTGVDAPYDVPGAPDLRARHRAHRRPRAASPRPSSSWSDAVRVEASRGVDQRAYLTAARAHRGDAVRDPLHARLGALGVRDGAHPFFAVRERHRVERGAHLGGAERAGEIVGNVDRSFRRVLADRQRHAVAAGDAVRRRTARRPGACGNRPSERASCGRCIR